ADLLHVHARGDALQVLPLQQVGYRGGGLGRLDPAEHLAASVVQRDRKSTRLNSSHEWISYAVFCLKKKNNGSAASRARNRLGTSPREAPARQNVPAKVQAVSQQSTEQS